MICFGHNGDVFDLDDDDDDDDDNTISYTT